MKTAVRPRLDSILPEGYDGLVAIFAIVREGTGKQFTMEDNRRWLEVTRPILEAFFHVYLYDLR